MIPLQINEGKNSTSNVTRNTLEASKNFWKELCDENNSPSLSQTLGDVDTSSGSSNDVNQTTIQDKNGSKSDVNKAAPWLTCLKTIEIPKKVFNFISLKTKLMI